MHRIVFALFTVLTAQAATLSLGDVTVAGISFDPWNNYSTRQELIFTAPQITANLYDYTSAQITLHAPTGYEFSVAPPSGAGVSYEGGFYYKIPGPFGFNGYTYLSGVTVAFGGLNVPAPAYNPSTTGRIDNDGALARFNLIDYDTQDVNFRFNTITITWTFDQIVNDPGSITYDVEPITHFHFYSANEIESPFVTLEQVATPEPSTWFGGALCIGVGLWRKRARKAV